MTLLAKRLVEPDHDTGPEYVETYGPAVADFNASIGFAPDPQQEHCLDKIFGIRPDGKCACFEYGCVVCRQNLKTGLFKQVAIGWLFVLEVPWFVWSAHEMSTTLESMREIHDLIAGSSIASMLPATRNQGLYEDNNKTRIELATGQRILFKARTQSGGRGLAAPKVILDEAFALRASHVGSLLPALAAQEDPQVLYGSSAGKADSDILRDIRDRGRSGASARLGYDEWLAEREDCADPDCRHPKAAPALGIDCALDRPHLRYKANPTLTVGRITMETLDGLRQALPPDEFARECLGWWDDPEVGAGPPAIDHRRWGRLANPDAPASTRAAVVLDVEPDQSAANIGLAGDGPDGKTLLMSYTAPGIAWMVDRLLRLKRNLGELLEVSLHPSGQVALLIPALQAAGIEYTELTLKDLGRGCAGFQAGVEDAAYVHLGQAELDAAVTVARTKTTEHGTQTWDRRHSPTPLGPLVATSTAAYRWALLTAAPEQPPSPPKRAARKPSRRSHDLNTAGF